MNFTPTVDTYDEDAMEYDSGGGLPSEKFHERTARSGDSSFFATYDPYADAFCNFMSYERRTDPIKGLLAWHALRVGSSMNSPLDTQELDYLNATPTARQKRKAPDIVKLMLKRWKQRSARH